MQRYPRRVCPCRRLVEDGERRRVRVEEVRDDEGGISSSENGKVDHGDDEGETVALRRINPRSIYLMRRVKKVPKLRATTDCPRLHRQCAMEKVITWPDFVMWKRGLLRNIVRGGARENCYLASLQGDKSDEMHEEPRTVDE